MTPGAYSVVIFPYLFGSPISCPIRAGLACDFSPEPLHVYLGFMAHLSSCCCIRGGLELPFSPLEMAKVVCLALVRKTNGLLGYHRAVRVELDSALLGLAVVLQFT